MLVFRHMKTTLLLLCSAIFMLTACSGDISAETEQVSELAGAEQEIDSPTQQAPEESDVEQPVSAVPSRGSVPAALLQPDDLTYRGAFRLPEEPADFGWGYSGYAMTYYPAGDPDGPQDGFPGSLFILGHDQRQEVGEVSIPAPVISSAKSTTELPTAATLQELEDITGGMFGELEIPRAGLAYLPAQREQESGKLHFCWGQHFQFENQPSHG